MADDWKKMLETDEKNELVKRFLEGEAVQAEDKLAFSCRACGGCCINTETIVTPPEVTRILWYMYRNHMPLQRIGEAFPGIETGLPIMNLLTRQGDGLNTDKRICMFLSPILKNGENGKLRESGKWVCEIYPARPSICRSYPVGRIQALPAAKAEGVLEEDKYCLQCRCPGFYPAEEKEVLLEGYKKPSELNLTVKGWVDKNTNAQMEEEKIFYVTEVIPAWIEGNKKIWPVEGGKVVIPVQEFSEFVRHLYGPPRPPVDPANDHAVIMRWMRALKELPALFEQAATALAKIAKENGRLPSEEEEKRASCFVQERVKQIMDGGNSATFEPVNIAR